MSERVHNACRVLVAIMSEVYRIHCLLIDRTMTCINYKLRDNT